MKKIGERDSMERALADAIIADALEQDPARVIQAVAAAVERLKSGGRYGSREIDAAAAQVCWELSIPWARRRN